MATIKAVGDQLQELMKNQKDGKYIKHQWFRSGQYKNGNEWCGYCFVCGLKRERIFNDYVYSMNGVELDKIPSCKII